MLLASVALFGSCEDFLSKEDPNKIDAPSYFRNETDLQTYVNGFLQTMSPTAASVATGDARTDCLAWRGEYQFLTDNFDADDQSGWGTSDWEDQGQDFRGSALVRFDDRFQRPRGALQASRQSRIRDAQDTRRHRIRQHVLHIEFGSGSQLRADHPIRRIGTQSPYLPL